MGLFYRTARAMTPAPVRQAIRRTRVRRLVPRIYRGIAHSGMETALLEYLLFAGLCSQPWERLRSIGRDGRPPLVTDVLYVTSDLSVDAIKDVINLRRHGGFTVAVLFSRDWGNRDLAERDGVQLVPYADYWDLAPLLLRARAPVAIARRGDPVGAALVAALFPGKLIYKAYDFVLRYPREMIEEMFPGAVSPLAEAFVLQRADGLLHSHEDGAIQYIREQYGFRGADAQVRPGCMDDFCVRPGLPKLSDRDGGIHIVYAAGLARNSSDKRKVGGGDHYDDFVQLLEQGLHLHVYIPYLTAAARRGLRHYFQLAEERPNLHIHETLPYGALARELTQYDYAFCYFPRRETKTLPEFMGTVGNNVFTYIDAGLPIICSPDFWSMAELVERHRMGVVVTPTELTTLATLLRGLNGRQLNDSVSSARPALMYPWERLVSLVEKVSATEPALRQPATVAEVPQGVQTQGVPIRHGKTRTG